MNKLQSFRVLVVVRVFVLMLVALGAAAGCGDDGQGAAGVAVDYDLEISTVGGAGSFGALQFEITHLGSSGGFLGRGDKVDCVALVEAISVANYKGERQVSVGMISLAGVEMPDVLVRCGFRTAEEVEPASFRIDVTDASDTNSKPLDPVPVVEVTDISRR